MSDKNIFLSPARYDTVKKTLLAGRTGHRMWSKIPAIKCLRTEWADENKPERLGLREAKQAIENLMADLDGDPRPWGDGWNLTMGLVPVSVRVGEVAELSLDEWELQILTKMGKLGLEEAGRLLELVTTIKAWTEGKQVGVIDKE